MFQRIVRDIDVLKWLWYLISPSFLAVADPTFFAAVAVLDPASLSTVLVAEAPLLSLLYLKYRGDQSRPSQYLFHHVCNTYVNNISEEFISPKFWTF